MRVALLFFFLAVLQLAVSDAEAAMYSYVDEYGGLHFTNVPADPRYQVVPGYDALHGAAVYGRYGHIIRTAAERFDLDPELIRAVIKVESRFNPYAVSEKGAMGLMQLMPETAAEMDVESPFEAEQNIMGGSRYLKKLLNLFDGDLRLGLAAYNAGPSRVMTGNSIPRIPETEQYVEKVLYEYGQNKSGMSANP